MVVTTTNMQNILEYGTV